MISTTDLTADQLEQLAALLADTTPGAGVYRPPVGRDLNLLGALTDAGLVIYTADCGYEITDAGKAIVVGRAKDLADGQAFVMYADDDKLLAAIDALKLEATRYLDGDGNTDLRERTLADIEACQNELDRRAEARTEVEDRSEGTGRHRLVPVDDRPTETIARVELPTEPMSMSGTLPDIPVAEILTDREGAERLLAAIQDMPSPADVAEYLAEPHTPEEWAELEADLADESSWWQRNVTDRLTPRRMFVLAIVVVSTWFVAWLVMGR